MRRLLLVLALLLAVPPARACINDRELPSHEREFRSQYGLPVVDEWESPSTNGRTVLDVLRWSGTAALMFALAAVLLGGRNRS